MKLSTRKGEKKSSHPSVAGEDEVFEVPHKLSLIPIVILSKKIADIHVAHREKNFEN